MGAAYRSKRNRSVNSDTSFVQVRLCVVIAVVMNVGFLRERLTVSCLLLSIIGI